MIKNENRHLDGQIPFMTHALSFRKHILKIKAQENMTLKEASERFKVGVASIARWMKHVEPKKHRNKPATKIDMEALKRDVEEHPDAYQYERAQRFGVSTHGIWQALKRLGVSYKKKPQTSKSMPRKARYVLPKDR